MANEERTPRRSALLSFPFLATGIVGSLIMALVSVLAPLPAQLAVLGALVSILAGLFVAFLEQSERQDSKRSELLEKLEVPVTLAPEHTLFDHYKAIVETLRRLAHQRDSVLREFADVKLSAIVKELRALGDGTIIFRATETWRTVYEDLLLAELGDYRSVAWVKTEDYWQDAPGRRSLRANHEFLQRGGRIERMLILRGDLWPAGETLPREPLRAWILEQQRWGISLSLLREGDLSDEPDILCDFGLYGDRAVGVQELDEFSRTQRFVLSFDPESHRLAAERWDRLQLYAVALDDLLEGASAGE